MAKHDIYKLSRVAPGERASRVKTAYALALGLGLLGVVVMGVAGGSVLSALTRGNHGVVFPGSTQLKLKPGVYAGVRDPRSTGTVAGLFVAVRDDLTGQSVPVMDVPPGAGRGAPLFQFQILDEGSYTVTGVISGDTARMLLLHESVVRVRSDGLVGALAGVLLMGAGAGLWFFVRRTAPKT
jgi:hypothetical protein